jgi:hypothetical protein
MSNVQSKRLVEALRHLILYHNFWPLSRPFQAKSDERFDFVTFNAYLLDRGSFKLADNDSLTHVSAELTADGWLDVRLDGIKRKAGLRVIPLSGRPAIQQVSVNGRALPAGGSFAASADVARRLGTGPEWDSAGNARKATVKIRKRDLDQAAPFALN